MAADVWVGLDLGTQSVRALAVAADGTVAGSGSRPLRDRRDGPRHEQDPDDWWRAVAAASRDALRDVEPAAVRGVAVDATSGTVLLVDRDGTPLTPGLMYDDTRAAAEVDRVNEVGAAVWQELGYQRMQPAWALPKLLWLLREHAAPGTRLAHQSDLVTSRLAGGPVATDLSNALKTGAHLIDETWPAGVFDALGVPQEVLPPLVRPGTEIGAVCAAAAEETGLPAGTPVVAGATDGCAAQLGAGVLTPGSWNSVLGTTLVLKGVSRELVRDPSGGSTRTRRRTATGCPAGRRAPAPARSPATSPAPTSTTSTGAPPRTSPPARWCTRWCRPASASRSSRRRRGASCSAPRPTTATGSPPCCRASRSSSGSASTTLHLLGAPLDGDLVLTGGATRSTYWNQLRADVLGRPVTLPVTAEPALGMAVLAASPGRDAAEVAAGMVRVREVVEPRPGAGARFTEPYTRFVDELERRGWLPAATARHARGAGR